ncbi:MAG: DEAD/DEAH box helicase [Planctomycetes bacterium]|nr:DEAD/DEAH box helicase [Planctomycetota bacterium]
MSVSLFITPGGQLRLEIAPESLSTVAEANVTALQAAVDESNTAVLELLASPQWSGDLPATLVFWRGFAREFFHAICQFGEDAVRDWKSAPPPSDEQLAQLIADAPPMRGLEYLTEDLFRSMWRELAEVVVDRATKFPEGPTAWLREINPLWHLLGRVTFHLAENPRDETRPFAFLATYTHRLARGSRLQHLPLADAVKTYAGAKKTDRIESLLEPVRRAAQRSTLVRELLSSKALFAPQAWSIGQAHRFLCEVPCMEEAGVVVRVPNWWSSRRPLRPQVQVRIGERAASQIGMESLLDFHIGLALDDESLSAKEQQQLLASTEGLVLLRGKWIEVDRQRLQEALDHWKLVQQSRADGMSFIEGMRLLAGASLEDSDSDDAAVASWSRVTAGNWLRETLERMRRPERTGGCQPGRDLRATLRHYQVEGVHWLWFMTELGLGACLADDMGLGKTIQVIDLLLQRKRDKTRRGPSLLVIPASLIGNWKQELARFGPSLQIFFAHRAECEAEELVRVARDPEKQLVGFDLVVTTYGLVRRQQWLAQVAWSMVVLDEAQAIKNASSAQTRSVKKLAAPARIAMTGTPVENHLGDLWSIFDFCCPGLLGSASQFKKYVKLLDKQQSAHAFGALRRLVRPYILRRLKTDPAIVPDLPEKTEMRTECSLSKKQAALYERAVQDLARRLQQAEGIARRGLVLAVLMQLKQICNHPAHYLGGGAFIPKESGKFERLQAVCEPIVERQEKMLVFTQFQSITEPLADYLATIFGRPGLVLHGGTPVRKRGELVAAFQSSDSPPFFVISLKAGGSGLNLAAASHVVHFDRWWNPAVENQATDRAFRIGQKRNVLVHKFVCRGTVEERIDAMIRDKQALADGLLDQEGETLLTELSDDELLRFVAIDLGRATADE